MTIHSCRRSARTQPRGARSTALRASASARRGGGGAATPRDRGEACWAGVRRARRSQAASEVRGHGERRRRRARWRSSSRPPGLRGSRRRRGSRPGTQRARPSRRPPRSAGWRARSSRPAPRPGRARTPRRPAQGRGAGPRPPPGRARQEAGAQTRAGARRRRRPARASAGRRSVRGRETLEAGQRGRRAAAPRARRGRARPGRVPTLRGAGTAGRQGVHLGAGHAAHIHLGGQPDGVEAPPHARARRPAITSAAVSWAPRRGRQSPRAAGRRPGGQPERAQETRHPESQEPEPAGAPRRGLHPCRARNPGRPGRAGRARTGAGGRPARRAGPRDAAPLPRRPRRRGRSALPSRGSTCTVPRPRNATRWSSAKRIVGDRAPAPARPPPSRVHAAALDERDPAAGGHRAPHAGPAPSWCRARSSTSGTARPRSARPPPSAASRTRGAVRQRARPQGRPASPRSWRPAASPTSVPISRTAAS